MSAQERDLAQRDVDMGRLVAQFDKVSRSVVRQGHERSFEKVTIRGQEYALSLHPLGRGSPFPILREAKEVITALLANLTHGGTGVVTSRFSLETRIRAEALLTLLPRNEQSPTCPGGTGTTAPQTTYTLKGREWPEGEPTLEKIEALHREFVEDREAAGLPTLRRDETIYIESPSPLVLQDDPTSLVDPRD